VPIIRTPPPRLPHQSPPPDSGRRCCNRRFVRCCICCSLPWRTLSCCWQCTTTGISLFVYLLGRISGTSSSGMRASLLDRVGRIGCRRTLRFAVASGPKTVLTLIRKFVAVLLGWKGWHRMCSFGSGQRFLCLCDCTILWFFVASFATYERCVPMHIDHRIS
jgi:hypothetical protein